MATQSSETTPTKESTSRAPRQTGDEVASVTTTMQGAPYAIKYERVVEDDQEYDELEIEEDEIISNDGSLFEEDDFEEEVGDRSLNVSNNDEEEERIEQKQVIKLQTINVRGVQAKKDRVSKSNEEEEYDEGKIHVMKHEIGSDEDYVYPPKKRYKSTASMRKKRRLVKVGRAGDSVSIASETEAKLNVVRRTEETPKPRRILLQSGGSGGGVSKTTTFPPAFRNAGVQCNIPRLDPIREGILAEMSLINDLFKLEVQQILNRPKLRRKKKAVGPSTSSWNSSQSSWHQPDGHHDKKSSGSVDLLRVVKKEINEDDTVEIVVCDSSCV